jgi:subtilisin family serine protease
VRWAGSARRSSRSILRASGRPSPASSPTRPSTPASTPAIPTSRPTCGSNSGEDCSGCRNDGVDNDGNGYVDDWRGWDFKNKDNNPFDDHGHGTHVAGTIGAVGNNGLGVTGLNWNVRLMALKFLGATGSGTTADAVKAVLYAGGNGASVTNNSWSGGAYSQALRDAIAQADAANSLFVAAAGNDGHRHRHVRGLSGRL